MLPRKLLRIRYRTGIVEVRFLPSGCLYLRRLPPPPVSAVDSAVAGEQFD